MRARLVKLGRDALPRDPASHVSTRFSVLRLRIRPWCEGCLPFSICDGQCEPGPRGERVQVARLTNNGGSRPLPREQPRIAPWQMILKTLLPAPSAERLDHDFS